MISDDDNNHVEVYIGEYYDKKIKKSSGRFVAFDLDETLGSFVNLEVLWYSLQHFTKKYEPTNFNSLLDLYPEFLRVWNYSYIRISSTQKKYRTM